MSQRVEVLDNQGQGLGLQNTISANPSWVKIKPAVDLSLSKYEQQNCCNLQQNLISTHC
jgi:hypothetical protein